MGSYRMRKYIIDKLEQFRKDVNDTHAHVYDDINIKYLNDKNDGSGYAGGGNVIEKSNDSIISYENTDTTESGGMIYQDDEDTDDTTVTPSPLPVSSSGVTMLRNIKASASTIRRNQFQRIDSSYDFI